MSIYILCLNHKTLLKLFREAQNNENRLSPEKMRELFGAPPFAGVFYSEDRRERPPSHMTYREFGPYATSQRKRLAYKKTLPPQLQELIEDSQIGPFKDQYGREYVIREKNVANVRVSIKTYTKMKKHRSDATPYHNEELVLRKNGRSFKVTVLNPQGRIRRAGTTAVELVKRD